MNIRPKVLLVACLIPLLSYGEDFFKDTFNRPGNTNIDASKTGQRGPLKGTSWTELQISNDSKITRIFLDHLELSNGGKASAASLDHNFIDPQILKNLGFRVTMTIAKIDGSSNDNYCGFGLGLSEQELARWTPPNQAYSIRGAAEGMGSADVWVGIVDPMTPKLEVRKNGKLVKTKLLSSAQGKLSAKVYTYSFEKDADAEVIVSFNDKIIDLNPGNKESEALHFKWGETDQNRIAIEGYASNKVTIDEFVVEHIQKPYGKETIAKKTIKKVINSKTTSMTGLFGLSLALLLLFRKCQPEKKKK